MATQTLTQKINSLNYFNLYNKLRDILTSIRAEIIPTDVQLEEVDEIGTTTALTAVPASFANEAEVQTYLVTLRANVEARLDVLDAKVDELIGALKA